MVDFTSNMWNVACDSGDFSGKKLGCELQKNVIAAGIGPAHFFWGGPAQKNKSAIIFGEITSSSLD